MYERSIKDPDRFWLEQATSLEWIKKPTAGRKYRVGHRRAKNRAHVV